MIFLNMLLLNKVKFVKSFLVHVGQAPDVSESTKVSYFVTRHIVKSIIQIKLTLNLL